MASGNTPEPGSTEGAYDNVPTKEMGEGYPEAPGRGARRRKVANYLKVANETWRSYQDSASTKWDLRRSGDENRGDPNMPGSFPDVSIVRGSGGEEMILFPSYCKRHIKTQKNAGLGDESLKSETGEHVEESEWWKQEWEKYENDKAIVDVDVRGWVYTPHRGPMNRKHRVLLGLVRQLSGIPAPKTPDSSRENSPARQKSLKERHDEHEARREQEKIEKEAEEMIRKGETEAEVAARGGYSEGVKEGAPHADYRGRLDSSASKTSANEPAPGSLAKRSSWNQPSDMSPDQLLGANTNLMARIMPFLANPLVSTPITVFFYDDNSSQSKTVTTNEAGHFNLRAALDFIPTHVRVLASETLSATEEVKITEPQGISLITDVDDTIKHSSIGSGAREIFRNAFVRDLSDLTIDGVREWYSTMYDMGVGIHYVSNSPWQLFPVLVQFFRTAGLPPGSYHLKSYSGMLQGIFEPVAERKKGTLERILRDFPERKFILVGDSGEADLEVYTDVVLSNPGRILGVFIRDVTTPIDKPFFDESYTATMTDRTLPQPVNQGSGAGDHPSNRPPLPERRTSEPVQSSTPQEMEDLISFDDEPKQPAPKSVSHADLSELAEGPPPSKMSSSGKPLPARPNKPMSLRSNTVSSFDATSDRPSTESGKGPPAPPRSRKPNNNNPLPEVEARAKATEPESEYSYMAAAKAKANRAYQAMPAVRGYLPSAIGGGSSSSVASVKSFDSQTVGGSAQPPPLPRRGYKATAASYAYSAANKVSGYKSTVADKARGVDRPSSSDSSSSDGPPVNKKFELWKRRWTRASELLAKEGVMLKTWRKGEDVADIAIKLVEKNMKDMGVEGYGKGKTGEGGGEVKVKDLKK